MLLRKYPDIQAPAKSTQIKSADNVHLYKTVKGIYTTYTKSLMLTDLSEDLRYIEQ